MDPEDGIDRNNTTAGSGGALPPPSFAPPAAPGSVPVAVPVAGPTTVGPASVGPASVDVDTGRRRRRWLLPTVAVVVVAALGVGAWLIVAGDDDEDADPASGRPAVLVRLDGDRVEVYDDDGETVTDTLDLDVGAFLTPIGGGFMADLDRLDEGTLVLVDPAAGTVEDYRVPENTDGVTPFGPDLVLAWGSELDVEPQVVNLLTRDAEDVSDLVDLDSRWTRPFVESEGDAARLLSLDAETTTTAILQSSGVDDAWLLEGAALDLHDGTALSVSGSKDDGFEIGLVTADGPIGKAADADGFPLGGLITGSSAALVVDADGTLLRLDADGGSLDDDRDLEIGEASFAAAVGVDRLVAGGDGGTVLLDATGTELARWPAGADGDLRVVGGGSGCIVLSSEDAPGPGSLLVDLETGDELVELTGMGFPRGDGCSFVALGSGADQVVVDGAEVDLGDVRIRSVDPVGGRVMLSDVTGDEPTSTLVDLEGNVIAELGEGIWILVP